MSSRLVAVTARPWKPLRVVATAVRSPLKLPSVLVLPLPSWLLWVGVPTSKAAASPRWPAAALGTPDGFIVAAAS